MVIDRPWLPDEYYSLFGKIVADYAQCRNIFNGSVMEVGSILDNGLFGFIDRVSDDELVELLGYLADFNLPIEEAGQFKALLKQWNRSSELRNKIAHSTWKFDKERNTIQASEGLSKIGEQHIVYRRGRMRLVERPKTFEIGISGLYDHVDHLEKVILGYDAWVAAKNPEMFGVTKSTK